MIRTKVLLVSGRRGGKTKEEIKTLMKDELEQAGHEVLIAQNVDDALYLVYHEENVSVMITEADITGYQDGVELIRAVHDINHGTTKTVLTSGRYVEELIELAHLAGATAYWSRPSSMKSLVHLIAQILQDQGEMAAEAMVATAPAMA
ncbi:MAG: Response regulator receiver domain protein [Parcubacteria group bacterium GW2011_GWA2_47_21]|nr:MAG: Response regulator receiver domain protein [Parcubacteria group bacterium GW2011_GWA2_47_21]